MKPRRSSVGFHGGQVLSLRLSQEALDGLRTGLQDGKERWREVDAEDGAILIDLGQVVYLRTESDDQHIGF
ncbi:MAG: hypothetical protein H0V22_06980 [Solirubrobacterales bacterium]|jgi:hypothetical protein|nr:hypothetical protein [Solirubrobacterales bacterium]